MRTWESWLRVLVVGIGGYHVVIGAGLTLSPGFQAWAVALYGAEVQWTPQTVYFIRIVGTFALALGLVLLACARHPAKHRWVIVSVAALFLLRSVVRHVHAAEVYQGFAISPRANAFTSGFFVAQALGLMILLWVVTRRADEPTRMSKRR